MVDYNKARSLTLRMSSSFADKDYYQERLQDPLVLKFVPIINLQEEGLRKHSKKDNLYLEKDFLRHLLKY